MVEAHKDVASYTLRYAMFLGDHLILLECTPALVVAVFVFPHDSLHSLL